MEITPKVKVGDTVVSGDTLGSVREGLYEHKIMVPFNLKGKWTVSNIKDEGNYTVDQVIATLKDSNGNTKECVIMQKLACQGSNKMF